MPLGARAQRAQNVIGQKWFITDSVETKIPLCGLYRKIVAKKVVIYLHELATIWPRGNMGIWLGHPWGYERSFGAQKWTKKISNIFEQNCYFTTCMDKQMAIKIAVCSRWLMGDFGRSENWPETDFHRLG